MTRYQSKGVRRHVAEWTSIPHFSKRKKAIDAIIIHYVSAIYTEQDEPYEFRHIYKILRDFQLSYHYVIDRKGKIFQLVDEEKKAWHAGISELWGEEDCNQYSIGIAFISSKGIAYKDDQIKAGINLCTILKKEYNIWMSRIVGHEHVSHEGIRGLHKGKKDPGMMFPWRQFLDEISYESQNRFP